MRDRRRPYHEAPPGGALLILLLALGAAGCASLGPRSIARDRLDYDRAIAESWKQQLLLNLVKIRYGDAPVFMEVASVISSYSLDTQVDLGASWQAGEGGLDTRTLGGSARYSDRPTITYNPLLGEHFTRSLMTPISPATVFSLIQSGWRADAVFRVTVSSANGLRNRYGARGGDVDPEFYRLAEGLRKLQGEGAIGIRVDRSGPQEAAWLLFAGGKLDQAGQQEAAAIRRALGLKPDASEFRMAFGLAPSGDREVALVTRSYLEVLFEAASWIDVPAADVAEQRVRPGAAYEAEAALGVRPLMKVSSGRSPPKDAFVSLRYRGAWFWVDDRDFASKQAFSFLMMLSSLADAGPARPAPIVTIPAG